MPKLSTFIRRWFPVRPDVQSCKAELARFYAENQAYRQMIGGAGKLNDPQVQFLSTLLKPGLTCVEYGCGDGLVAAMVAVQADCIGFDVSDLALEHARSHFSNSNISFSLVHDGKLDLPDNSVDLVYSFEVLEHLWDPFIAINEMIRVLKPGGKLLISMPNILSLDRHLPKGRTALIAETCMALLRRFYDVLRGHAYINVTPQLHGEVYADCDLVTVPILPAFVRKIELAGCEVEFWDTTYMRAHARGSETDLSYQKDNANSFLKCFGDHLLLLSVKRNTGKL